MASPLPVLKRTNAPEAAPNPELRVPQLDTSAQERTGNAIANVGENILKGMEQVEKAKVESVSRKAANQLENEYKEALYGPKGVSKQIGDPDKLYADFDAKMKSRYDEILASSDLSDKAKARFEEMVSERYSNLYDLRTTSYGNQAHNYESGLLNDELYNAKLQGMDATMFMQAGKPETTKKFDDAIRRVFNARLDFAQKFGGVEEIKDAEGNVVSYKLDPKTDMEFRKDRGDMVHDAVDNLISANQPAIAHDVLKKYGAFIDPAKMDRITAKLHDADVKVKAFEIVTSLGSKTFDEQRKILSQVKDSEVKQKALELQDSRTRYYDDLEKRSSTAATNSVLNIILDREKRGEQFQDVLSMEEDPMVKRLLPQVTSSKDRQAIYQMLEQPKNSDPEAFQGMLQTIYDGSIKTLQPSELAEKSVNLSKSDRDWFKSEWRKQVSETTSQETSRARYAQNRLRSRLMEIPGLIKRDEFGKPTKDGLELRGRLEQSMLTNFDSFPKNASTESVNQWIEKYVTDQVIKKNQEKSSSFFGDFFGGFFGSKKLEVKPLETFEAGPSVKGGKTQKTQTAPPEGGTPAQPPSGGASLKQMQDTDIVKWNSRFRAANGGAAPKSMDELNNFIQEQTKKQGK